MGWIGERQRKSEQLPLFDFTANRVENALGASAIPSFWHGARNFRFELLPCGLTNPFSTRSRKDIRANFDCDGSLCILTHSDAWDSKARGFFLDASRVGHDYCGVLH
jgi:hypothetical protein